MVHIRNDIIFQISNIQFQILNLEDNSMEDAAWNQFISNDSGIPEVKLQIIRQESLDYQLERYNLTERPEQVFRYGTEILLVNDDWSVCTLLAPKDRASLFIFTNHIFYSRALYHQMIQFHSSLVEWDGCGILFLGPSGIGKTTQAELWAQYKGADIINGDLVFVQKTAEGFLGWGTPWHGSSPYCLNKAVHLKALIILRQSSENAVRKLNGFEKVSEVSQNLFYPTWLQGGVEWCTKILDDLLTCLPVFRLDNRADEQSVEILVEELEHDG